MTYSKISSKTSNFRNKYKPLRLYELDRTKRIMLALPIERYNASIPFGYKVNPKNANLLIPVPKEFKALLQARKYLISSSYKEVAEWLCKTTGKYISSSGLHKIMAHRPPHPSVILPMDTRIQLYDFYANYYGNINELAMIDNDIDDEGNIVNSLLNRAINKEVDIYLSQFIEEEMINDVERPYRQAYLEDTKTAH